MGVTYKYKRVENTEGYDALSQSQKDVIYYLTTIEGGYLTPSQIANLRGVSSQAISKIITKLIKKGFVKRIGNGGYVGGGYSEEVPQTPKGNNIYRLHRESLKVRIQNSSNHYEKLIKTTKNKDEEDNNTIMLYKDFLIIYGKKDFYNKDPYECERQSVTYWDRFITILENKYKITMKRAKVGPDILFFTGEIAKTNDPVARKLRDRQERLRVIDNKGELRLITDFSGNIDELEAVHPRKHIKDMGKIHDIYLDIIENDSYKLSEASKLIDLLTQNHINTKEKIEKQENSLNQASELLNMVAVELLKIMELIQKK